MSYHRCYDSGMNLNQLSVAGPYTHDNLSMYLLLGSDTFDGNRFIPLDDALEQKCVVVHETGNVGELEVENLSELFDLYIQAGDVVKGGRQDHTLGVDFVLPAKSGRVAIPSFCVENGRWHRRPLRRRVRSPAQNRIFRARSCAWPDTETGFNCILRDAGVVPTFIGDDRNGERQTDENIDHVRSYAGSKIYSEKYHAKAVPWMEAAVAEARARTAAAAVRDTANAK